MRCNYCFLQDVELFARETGRPLTSKPSAAGTGYDIAVGGAHVAWLENIPSVCACAVVFDDLHAIAESIRERGASLDEPFACPDCNGSHFLEGPHGGMSINFCCAACGARFNDCVGWIDRTPADGDERTRFAGDYRPRTAYMRQPGT